MSEMHDAALRAGIWQVVEQRARELKDAAKAELLALEVGDTVAGKHNGQTVAKATMTSGRRTLTVVDEAAFLDWVRDYHPTEIVETVRPAYFEHIKACSRDKPCAIDASGEVVPGVEWVQGSPSVSVRREKDAPFLVAQLLSQGRLSLDGIQALEPAPEPLDRFTQDRIASGVIDE